MDARFPSFGHRRERASLRSDKSGSGGIDVRGKSHEALLASTRSLWDTRSPPFRADTEWLRTPPMLPSLLREISNAKSEEKRRINTFVQRDAQEAQRRKLMTADPFFRHPVHFHNGKQVSPFVRELLWRHPDTTPNARPDYSFRPRFILPPNQAPWLPVQDFPQACSRKLSVHDRNADTTRSYKAIVNNVVRHSVESIDRDMNVYFADVNDGMTASVAALRDDLQRSSAEMHRVLNRVSLNRKRTNITVAQRLNGMGNLTELLPATVADPAFDDDHADDRDDRENQE